MISFRIITRKPDISIVYRGGGEPFLRPRIQYGQGPRADFAAGPFLSGSAVHGNQRGDNGLAKQWRAVNRAARDAVLNDPEENRLDPRVKGCRPGIQMPNPDLMTGIRTFPWMKNLLLLTLPSQLAVCQKAFMILSPTDTMRFFRLYWGLNAYVNQQLAVIPKQFTADSFRNIPIEQLAVVRDALIANPELLQRYLAEDPHHLSPEDRDVVSSWRLRRAGQFVVVRHLKKYSVFLDDKPPGHLYGVIGLQSPIHEMLKQKPPVLASTVLLPFCGAIVTDGLISSAQVYLGPNIQEDIRQHYNRIKLRTGIIASLDSEKTSIQGKPDRRPALDWGGEVDEIAARAQRLRAAGEPQQRAVLNLLRASAGLAQAVFHAPGERYVRLRTLRRAVTQIEQLLGGELWDV